MHQLEFKITGDGSHTLYVPELGEHYHSVFGAIAESMHIFIGAGLRSFSESKGPVKILEVGFGTGLNALLTGLFAEVKDLDVNYVSLEKYPLSPEMASRFNFPARLISNDVFDLSGNPERIGAIFKKIHNCPWNEVVKITDHFVLSKLFTSLEAYRPVEKSFDLVYFDAFGPDVQPELWTGEVFGKIGNGVKEDGILVTYSTKGEVKRNLKKAGFVIEKLPGPPGKREILRATKKA